MASDYRTSGAHDCDRILYSSAYRRLTGVTQVVAVGERQLFHNRLTHTQKVAQLSRRIAQYINWDEKSRDGRARLPEGHVDEDCAEAAGLAHDLGHPPFGHVAEHALNVLCNVEGADGFEGNAQSFRIVTKLSAKKSGSGLGLSNRTLNAILKYPWKSDSSLAKQGKWGAYLTESVEFDLARDGDTTSNKSVEAEIMDLADDISYAVHDLEDFYRAGFIPLARILRDPVEIADFLGRADQELHGKPYWDRDLAASVFDKLADLMPITHQYSGTNRDRQLVSSIGSVLINQYVSAAQLNPDGTFKVSSAIRQEILLLKQLTWQYVIEGPALVTLQHGQVEITQELFTSLFDWGASERKVQRLPTRLREMHTEAQSEYYISDNARWARTVADYIASLTEDQAIDLHARLRGLTRGSIHDTWVTY